MNKDKLEAKCEMVPEAGCWLWPTVRTYGAVFFDGRPQDAHRVAYQLYKGPIPVGMVVRHRCDTTSCVNPDHLTLGSQRDNAMDCISRGRAVRSRGQQHYKAKLTDAEVEAIRLDQGAQQDIAARFNCAASLVSMIKSGKARKVDLS